MRGRDVSSMNRQNELRKILARAFLEWRDAGGRVETVVEAIENLIRDIATEDND